MRSGACVVFNEALDDVIHLLEKTVKYFWRMLIIIYSVVTTITMDMLALMRSILLLA